MCAVAAYDIFHCICGLQVREWHNIPQVEFEFTADVDTVPPRQSVADGPC